MKKIILLHLFIAFSTVMKVYSQVPSLIANTEGIIKAEKVNNQIFFFKMVDSSDTWVQQLWKTGLSISSATMVKSFGALYGPIGSVGLTQTVNGKLYFVVALSPNDQQLWVSDGTGNGTFPLFATSNIYALFDFNNQLYFSASSYNNNAINGMYKTDGTVAGTLLLKNFPTEQVIYNYVKFNNKIIFTTKKGVVNKPTTNYMEIWSTDGTSSGFVRLDSLYGDVRRYAGGNGLNTPSQYFREYNGYLYFVFINTVNASDELWRTNGEVNGASYFYEPFHPIIEYNGKLILAGGNSSIGTELFSTDGTTAGTTLIKDINTSGPGLLSSKPSNFNITCNKLFFLAVDSGITASRIWVTDGTTDGTMLHTAPRGSYYPITQQSNGILYYAYQDNNNDSVKVFMVDTAICNSVQVMSWPYAVYGNVSQIIQLNPLFVILSGGATGTPGLFGHNLVASIDKIVENNKREILFYPNPTSDKISLTGEFDSVKITNMFGETVLHSGKNTQDINLETISDGVYTITLYSKGISETRKLVIKR